MKSSIKVFCTCGEVLDSMESLLVCESCKDGLPRLCCPACTKDEIVSLYCPRCYKEHSTNEAQGQFGCCLKCFVCPLCEAPASISEHDRRVTAKCGNCSWSCTLDIPKIADENKTKDTVQVKFAEKIYNKEYELLKKDPDFEALTTAMYGTPEEQRTRERRARSPQPSTSPLLLADMERQRGAESGIFFGKPLHNPAQDSRPGTVLGAGSGGAGPERFPSPKIDKEEIAHLQTPYTGSTLTITSLEQRLAIPTIQPTLTSELKNPLRQRLLPLKRSYCPCCGSLLVSPNPLVNPF